MIERIKNYLNAKPTVLPQIFFKDLIPEFSRLQMLHFSVAVIAVGLLMHLAAGYALWKTAYPNRQMTFWEMLIILPPK